MRHLDKIVEKWDMTGREYLRGQAQLVEIEARMTGNKRPRDDYYRIRAGRAKFTRREVVNVWADQTDSFKPGRRELVHLGQETITHHRSAVYVRDTTIDQLVKWATAEHLRRLEEAEGLPF
jgi:hypothetical protein